MEKIFTVFVDESGFTGEDLLATDQPIFVLSSNNFTSNEAEAMIDAAFGGVDFRELKHSRLIRSPKHRDRIVELVRIAARDPTRVSTWIAHKEFALVTLIVDWWLEPLYHREGFNLYKDGANLAMANMIFVCLEGFWSKGFRRTFLTHFQHMLRSRTQHRFAECEKFVLKQANKVDTDRQEILHYFAPSFDFLGFPHVQELPKRVLDLALPGLVFIGHSWRERFNGSWEVVHDNSSNMGRQKWMWDTLSSPQISPAQFNFAKTVQSFPMNVSTTRFGNSTEHKQLQICDILAGATSSFLRSFLGQAPNRNYCDRLSEAGIENLIVGNIWPSKKVTPSELGTVGVDANVAIEWISKQFGLIRNTEK